MADETIVTEFVVNIQGALSDVLEWRKSVDAAKESIRSAMQATGQSIKDVTSTMAEQRKEIVSQNKGTADYALLLKQNAQVSKIFGQAQREISVELRAVDSELKQKPKDLNDFQKSLKSLGTFAQFVFGTVLGITAISAFGALKSAISQAIEQGDEFIKTVFRLNISIQNLQARGLDVTVEKVTAQIKELRKEFGIFTTQELMGAVANVQLLTANFGFSADEMARMTKQAVTLSIITGKTVDEAAKELALFYSSGYSEGLQRAGLAINKLSVSTKAYEQGLVATKTAYTSLTEYQRAHIAYQVVEEQMTTLQGKAVQGLTSDYGKLLKAQADLKEQQQTMGAGLVPLQLAWTKFINGLVNGFLKVNHFFAELGSTIWAFFITTFKVIGVAFDMFLSGQKVDGEQLQKIWGEAFEGIKAELMKINPFGEFDPYAGLKNGEQGQPVDYSNLVDGVDEAQSSIENLYKEFMGIIQDYNKKYFDIQQEFLDKVGSQDESTLASIFSDWDGFFSNRNNLDYESGKELLSQEENIFGEFGSITEEGLWKAQEIWQKYYEKIDDINRKLAEDIEDENRNYQQDLQDLEFDTQQKLEDAARKHRYNELRAEREFQEKMRRLREEFLYDLEDALRERDALQVLRLVRKYRLDVEQAKRQYELDRQERLEAYQQEIEDIKRQAERKRKELEIEHKRKLADLEREAERERKQAAEDRQKAMDELIADMQKEREAAAVERQQALDELKQWLEDQLTELLAKYGEMEGVTEDMVKKMSNLFSKYMGKGGVINLTLDKFNDILQDAVDNAKEQVAELKKLADEAQAMIDQINQASENSEDASSGQDKKGRSSGGYATYGRYTLGESGREFILTAQTTKMLERSLGSLNQNKVYMAMARKAAVQAVAQGDPVVHISPGSQNSFTANINLADGLIAEIIDQAMDETSKVYLTATRERR